MTILFKRPVCWLVGACAIAGLALGSLSEFESTSAFPAHQHSERGTSADSLTKANLRPTGLTSADDSAKVSLELTSLQVQIKNLKAAYSRLAHQFRNQSLEIGALRDASRPDDDVGAFESDLPPEAGFEFERSRLDDFETLLGSEPSDAAGASILHERIQDLLAQRESQAQLVDVHCGVSLCAMTLNVTSEDFMSDDMLVDSILDNIDGGGTMMFDAERGQLVLYAGRNGQSVPRLDPERS